MLSVAEADTGRPETCWVAAAGGRLGEVLADAKGGLILLARTNIFGLECKRLLYLAQCLGHLALVCIVL